MCAFFFFGKPAVRLENSAFQVDKLS